MNAVQAQIAIEERAKALFNTTWARQPAVKIVYENVATKRPEAPYINLFIQHLNSIERGYGGNRITYRRFAMIRLQIFTEKNIGAKLGRQIGATIQTIFEGQQFGGITCREYVLTELGADWVRPELYQLAAKVHFDYDETVTY